MPNSSDSWQAIIALCWPMIQEWIKNNQRFTWFSKFTPKANAALSVAVALASTLGIHFTYSYSPSDGGALGVSLPAVSVLQHAIAAWLLQHVAYKAYVKGPALQTEAVAHLAALRANLPPPVPQLPPAQPEVKA